MKDKSILLHEKSSNARMFFSTKFPYPSHLKLIFLPHNVCERHDILYIVHEPHTPYCTISTYLQTLQSRHSQFITEPCTLPCIRSPSFCRTKLFSAQQVLKQKQLLLYLRTQADQSSQTSDTRSLSTELASKTADEFTHKLMALGSKSH